MAVMLTSRERVSRTELTLTENISDRGARVVTKQVWSPNDSLVIKSLEGDLQSEARESSTAKLYVKMSMRSAWS